MPAAPGSGHQRKQKTLVVRLLIAFDVVIVLFPPLHWAVGSPGSYASLAYFVVTSVLLLVSLLAIYALSRADEEN